MKTKPRDLGTRFETFLVNYWIGRHLVAWRIAEKGTHDEGDIFLHPDWTIEAKARANLNVSQTLAKAEQKAQTQNVAVAWKKLTRKAGNQRRTPDGVEITMTMSLDIFTRLVGTE